MFPRSVVPRACRARGCTIGCPGPITPRVVIGGVQPLTPYQGFLHICCLYNSLSSYLSGLAVLTIVFVELSLATVRRSVRSSVRILYQERRSGPFTPATSSAARKSMVMFGWSVMFLFSYFLAGHLAGLKNAPVHARYATARPCLPVCRCYPTLLGLSGYSLSGRVHVRSPGWCPLHPSASSLLTHPSPSLLPLALLAAPFCPLLFPCRWSSTRTRLPAGLLRPAPLLVGVGVAALLLSSSLFGGLLGLSLSGGVLVCSPRRCPLSPSASPKSCPAIGESLEQSSQKRNDAVPWKDLDSSCLSDVVWASAQRRQCVSVCVSTAPGAAG